MIISAVSLIPIMLGVIALLAAHWFVAGEFYKAAAMKGWNERKYFWLSFLCWYAGYLLIIALPDRAGAESAQVVMSDDLPEL